MTEKRENKRIPNLENNRGYLIWHTCDFREKHKKNKNNIGLRCSKRVILVCIFILVGRVIAKMTLDWSQR